VSAREVEEKGEIKNWYCTIPRAGKNTPGQGRSFTGEVKQKAHEKEEWQKTLREKEKERRWTK